MNEAFDQTEKRLLEKLDELGLRALLRLTENGYELLSPDPQEKPIFLDVEKQLLEWKNTMPSKRAQPLYRALGIKGQHQPFVWDVTCGLAGDSLQLLSLGCKVFSTERHPLPALMLLRAYESWNGPFKANWLLDLSETPHIPELVDTIYFDPMYQEVNGSALPRKEMRIFREVIGPDKDARDVAQNLRQLRKRLIIKRPLKSAPLMPPSFSQEGKAVSFDVYLP